MTEQLRKSQRKARLISTDDENRSAVFLLTNGSVDRDGETVDPEGADLSDYSKNSVVAFNHSTDNFPIGMMHPLDPGYSGAPEIWLDDVDGQKALLGRVYFSKENPQGDLAYRMVREGSLKGGSISFLPNGGTQKNDSGGNHYSKWRLLEFSVCPLPSNPDALRMSKKLKDAASPCKAVVEKKADGWYVRLSGGITESVRNKAVALSKKLKSLDDATDKSKTEYLANGVGPKKVVVTDGVVTYSDVPEFCPVGQKPNLDFLRKTGWKPRRKPPAGQDVWGSPIKSIDDATDKYLASVGDYVMAGTPPREGRVVRISAGQADVDFGSGEGMTVAANQLYQHPGRQRFSKAAMGEGEFMEEVGSAGSLAWQWLNKILGFVSYPLRAMVAHAAHVNTHGALAQSLDDWWSQALSPKEAARRIEGQSKSFLAEDKAMKQKMWPFSGSRIKIGDRVRSLVNGHYGTVASIQNGRAGEDDDDDRLYTLKMDDGKTEVISGVTLEKKSLRRKLWTNKNRAWLLKSEGAPDEATQQYLEDRGLDDVRIEEAPPEESGEVADQWVEDKAGSNALLEGQGAYSDGEPRSSNPHDRGTKEWMEWDRGWQQEKENVSWQTGKSKGLLEPDPGESPRDFVGRVMVRSASEVGESGSGYYVTGPFKRDILGGPYASRNEAMNAIQEASKKSIRKNKSDSPAGYRALSKWIKMLEDDSRDIEKAEVLDAKEEALKALKRAMKRAYKDMGDSEVTDNAEVSLPVEESLRAAVDEGASLDEACQRAVQDGADVEDVAKAKRKMLGRKKAWFDVFDADGSVVGSIDASDEASAIRLAKQRYGNAITVEAKSATNGHAKRLSKSERDELQEMAAFLTDVADAGDTPKRLSAGMRHYASKIKQKFDDLDAIGSEEVVEDIAPLEAALKVMAGEQEQLSKSLYRATGQRI